MFRKVFLAALIFISVICCYSCASGPTIGPISAHHVQQMKSAKNVYLSVTAREAIPGTRLPISIRNDSKNILKASGFDITTNKQAADLFVKIYAEGHIIRAAYGQQMVMPRLRRTHAAGSKIYGWILFELPNKDSYIRKFSGVVNPPKKISSVAYLTPRFQEAYEKSNFTKTFVATLVEIFGSGIDKKIYAALERTKKKQLIEDITDALDLLVSYKKRNKKLIDKIATYKEGLVSEKQFFQDGWNLIAPFEGYLGILEFKKGNLRSGIDEYILGYWVPATKLESLPIIKHIRELNKTFSDVSKSSSNTHFKFDLVGSTRIEVCKLSFSKGLLISKICK